ncbi:MAG: prepilin peptidase [Anaerolineae bacterium]|nr:prepilin peptidase [Anaerolineae bacterium]
MFNVAIIAVMICGLLLGRLILRASDALPVMVGYSLERRSMATDRLFERYARYIELGVQVGCALVAGLLWWTLGAGLTFGIVSVVFCLLLLITLIDLKYRLVLNLVVYPALVGALVLHLGLGQPILPFALGGFFAFGIFYLVARIKPGTLGGGDVKLAALLGVTFGFPNVLGALLVGGGLAAVVAITLLVQRKNSLTLPYAPFLCVGALVALLLNWLPMLAGRG